MSAEGRKDGHGKDFERRGGGGEKINQSSLERNGSDEELPSDPMWLSSTGKTNDDLRRLTSFRTVQSAF
jgi:hypothetical protein